MQINPMEEGLQARLAMDQRLDNFLLQTTVKLPPEFIARLFSPLHSEEFL
jgi:hypothetical protein